MSWECGCGVLNKDSKTTCRACRTPQGMVWSPHGFVSPKAARFLTKVMIRSLTSSETVVIRASFQSSCPSLASYSSGRISSKARMASAIFANVAILRPVRYARIAASVSRRFLRRQD